MIDFGTFSRFNVMEALVIFSVSIFLPYQFGVSGAS